MLFCSLNSIAVTCYESLTTFKISLAFVSNSSVKYWSPGVLHSHFIQFITFRKCGQLGTSSAGLTLNIQLLSPVSLFNVRFTPRHSWMKSSLLLLCQIVFAFWHFIPEVLVAVYCFFKHCVNGCIWYYCFLPKSRCWKRDRYCPSALCLH